MKNVIDKKYISWNFDFPRTGLFHNSFHPVDRKKYFVTHNGENTIISIELGELTCDDEVLYSLSIATESGYSFQCAIRNGEGVICGRNIPMGEGYLPEKQFSTAMCKSEIDYFTILKNGIYVMEVVITGVILQNKNNCPLLLTFSIIPPNLPNDSIVSEETDVLDVPQYSQMEKSDDIKNRICSPTSVAMVKAFWNNNDIKQENILTRAYSHCVDLYGVWPQNIWAASDSGMIGYLFPIHTMDDIISFMKRKIPLIVSIKYGEGELHNSAIEKTSGHLIVIVGIEKEFVVVNDPAGMTSHYVRRRYIIREFQKALIHNRGIAYVLGQLNT